MVDNLLPVCLSASTLCVCCVCVCVCVCVLRLCLQVAVIPMNSSSSEAFEEAAEEGGHALEHNYSSCTSISLGGTMTPELDVCYLVK